MDMNGKIIKYLVDEGIDLNNIDSVLTGYINEVIPDKDAVCKLETLIYIYGLSKAAYASGNITANIIGSEKEDHYTKSLQEIYMNELRA